MFRLFHCFHVAVKIFVSAKASRKQQWNNLRFHCTSDQTKSNVRIRQLWLWLILAQLNITKRVLSNTLTSIRCLFPWRSECTDRITNSLSLKTKSLAYFLLCWPSFLVHRFTDKYQMSLRLFVLSFFPIKNVLSRTLPALQPQGGPAPSLFPVPVVHISQVHS